jgi:PIN domain nuclease of toxin-antitoxin system
MLFVTDTHPLVWYLLGELPERVDEIFRLAEAGDSTIFIPTIVLAECLYLVEEGKIELDFNDLLGRLGRSKNFIPTSFNFQVMKLLPEINLRELHDRIIIATAKILNAQLITKDRVIRESGLVAVVW